MLASVDRVVIIDAGQYYFSDQFTGTRIAIMAFDHVCAGTVFQDTKGFLRSLGFRSSMLAPLIVPPTGGGSLPSAAVSSGSCLLRLPERSVIVRARPLRVRVLEVAGNGNWTSRTQKSQIWLITIAC